MKHYNQNLLRHYFTEPAKQLNAGYDTYNIHTKDIMSADPELLEIKESLDNFQYQIKMFSLKLLQKSSNNKYQLETVRSLNTKAQIIEKHIAEKSYLSPKSILEIKNRLKNYIFTFNIIKGEYLEPV